MFEEDFDRCFICQQSCKGLYCSSECRMQDKGTTSPPIHHSKGSVRLTAQLPPNAVLPVTLSPRARSTVPIGPSPKMPVHGHSNGDWSSSSSITSSPIHSPRTNPSSTASPNKDNFDLPPPAYSNQQNIAFPISQTLGFPGSVPVRIPLSIPRPGAMAMPRHGDISASHGSTVHPGAASTETLHYGRIPSITNSVTSPTALLPRCACGKPANHPGRPSNRDQAAFDPGFAQLSLGPSITSRSKPPRVPDALQPPAHTPLQHGKAQSGQVMPNAPGLNIADLMGMRNGALLSRSRSDPIPPSPIGRRTAVAPFTSRDVSAMERNRKTAVADKGPYHLTDGPGGGVSLSNAKPGVVIDTNPTTLSVMPPRRGRSRERQDRPSDTSAIGLLHQPGEREQAPSRSRHRRDERERRQAERDRTHGIPATLPAEPPQISPTSRRTSHVAAEGTGEGVVPQMRRQGSGGKISPHEEKKVNESDAERRAADLRRASKQLGQVFGVAAG